MHVPANWLCRTEFAQAVGVADKDGCRRKFFRNLQNWRDRDVLPELCDGLPVPMLRWHGGRTGNEAFYPPAFIPLVRRIKQFGGGDMREWRWQLLLEGCPYVDIVKYCRERLSPLANEISKIGADGFEREATRKPEARPHSLRYFYRLMRRRRLGVYLWRELVKWMGSVAAGLRLSQSIFDPGSLPCKALAGILNISADTLSACLAGSGIEEMSFRRLLQTIENANATELQRALIDCRALGGLKLKGMPSRIKHNLRAVILPALIMLRRSPDHQEDIAARLATAKTATEKA